MSKKKKLIKVVVDKIKGNNSSESQFIIPNINKNQAESMEVHHHSHTHSNGSWKSYLWEFLMLFLAVFCGFLAEYKLEHVIEHQREATYIKSMVEDAEKDIHNIKEAIIENELRISHLDTLAEYCSRINRGKLDEKFLYDHYLFGIKHPSFVKPTERTMMQLKNSGGMRLIQNKNSIEKIIEYDNMAIKLSEQQEFYRKYQNTSIELSSQIFNYRMFGIGKLSSHLKDSFKLKEFYILNSKDEAKILEFANSLYIYEGVVLYYNKLLTETLNHAQELILVLKKEYKLP